MIVFGWNSFYLINKEKTFKLRNEQEEGAPMQRWGQGARVPKAEEKRAWHV